MYRIESPFSDATLLLTPSLGSFSRITQLLLLLGIILLLFGLMFWLYLQEAKLIARRYAIPLLGLRMSIVAVIFLVIGFRPKWSHTTYETLPSKVLVAIDRSDSMAIDDPQRGGLEKIELAHGLKIANDIVDNSTLDDWANRLRSGGVLNERDRKLYDALATRVDPMLRKQIALRVLHDDGIGLLKGIGDKHYLEVVGFTQQLTELPHTYPEIEAIIEKDGKTPGDSFTDLKLPLKRALERGGAGEGKLLGIVILTDGQHNWGENPIEWINKLKESQGYETGEDQPKLPVYSIVCGPRIPPSDIAVTYVRAMPSTVFKHAYATVEARVLINNFPPGKIKITLTYPDVPDLPKRKPIVEYIEHDGAPRSIRTITIQAKMDRAASESLRVTAEAEPTENQSVRDRFPENNFKDVIVNVAPDKAKVLVIDGEARWELHYLQTALLRDETMETKSVVFDQPRLNLVREDEIKAMHLPDSKLPEGEDALMSYDCIILGDISPEQLPRADRDRIEKYVAERGGTLVMLAGKRSMPMEFLKPDDPFLKLLPIQNPRAIDTNEGFQVQLSSEGKQTGFMRLEPESGLSQERWSALPLHYWGVVGKTKEGAVSLAYYPSEGRLFGADVNLLDRERSNALIVRQNYGFGRSVFVGLDSTWRWRFRKGDLYHHRFWSQIIRWAASDRALITGNEFVRFGVRQPVYRSDEEVEILVRLNEKVKKLAPTALAGARFYRKKPNGDEESITLTPLKPHPIVPRELDGSQSNLPPGEYAMELAIPDIEDKLNGPDGKKLRTHFKVLPPDTGELMDLSTNWELLEEMAKKTGGAVYAAADAGQLLEKLQSQTTPHEIHDEKKLWQSWWMLIPLLVLLGIEWGLRKIAGLP